MTNKKKIFDLTIKKTAIWPKHIEFTTTTTTTGSHALFLSFRN